MSDYVSSELRTLVATRAAYLCEYCLMAEEDTFLGCEVDHIISLKHGGKTEENNLAFACTFCNRYKGSDIASVSSTGELVRLFNPRIDLWSVHFLLDNFQILPITSIGEVTVKIIGMNRSERILEREALSVVNRYPSPLARKRMMK